ncbi:uncharacterized protein LOC119190921 [Manduca sexta]|uniref:uncharacterized protein LOC119190921 n=1 Tax=Manduca sexta TaxID=7130 RepID=UPI00188EA999|nr:uncharacterized protein LOC119190921 [Manduca sexta]
MKDKYIEIIEMFLKTSVFCACIAMIAAQDFNLDVSNKTLAPKPEKFKNLEGCYIPEKDTVIPLNARVAWKDKCLEYRCYSQSYEIAECSTQVPDFKNNPKCFMHRDYEKPYPECCPKIACYIRSISGVNAFDNIF